MNNKIVHLSLSLGFIIWAFFFGISFGEKYYNEKIQNIEQTYSRVDITFSGKTLNIKKENENISVFFNGEKLGSNKQTFSISK